MADKLQQYEAEFTAAIAYETTGVESGLRQKIKPSSRLPAQLALDIYRNNTRGARVNALEQIYPICARILGTSTFRAIARDYTAADTRGSADLNTYGEGFCHHLARLHTEGRLADDFIYLSDLAVLEYKFHRAYFVDDDPEFGFFEFEHSVQNGAMIYFRLSQALSLLSSKFPLYQIWRSNHEHHKSDNVNAIGGVQYLVVYRDDFRPAIATVEPCEYRLLDAIAEKTSLQQLIDETACPVDQLLPKMIAQKWIVGFEHHE